MKTLITILISIILFSCGPSKEEESEQTRLYETYYNFSNNKGMIYRNRFEAAYIDYYDSKFLKDYHSTLVRFDSSMIKVINLIDSCIKVNNYDNYETVIAEYNKVMDDLEKAFEDLEGQEEEPFRSNLNILDKSNKKLLLLRLKIDLAISYSNYLQVVYNNVDSSCGYTLAELNSTSTLDSNGRLIIRLESEAMQLMPKGRQMILDEVTKNGKKVNVSYNFVDNYTFSNLIIDSLKNGNYTLKGMVRYYGGKGMKEYPFEEKVTVKN